MEKATNERLDGIWVDWKMVKAEGWSTKNGSKWKTMADQMFVYRAAAFWQRAYAPELGMGLQTQEEVQDTIDAMPGDDGTIRVDEAALRQASQPKRPARAADKRRAAEPTNVQDVDPETGEVLEAASEPEVKADEPAQEEQQAEPIGAPDYDQVAHQLRAASSMDTLDIAADLIQDVEHPEDQEDLRAIYQQRREELNAPQQQPRRTRRAMNVE